MLSGLDWGGAYAALVAMADRSMAPASLMEEGKYMTVGLDEVGMRRVRCVIRPAFVS